MKFAISGIAAVFCFTALPAKAATLFSTLGQSSNAAEFYSTTDYRYASDFETGAQTSSITGISTAMGNPDSIAHTFKASIFSSVAGAPDSLVGAFSTQSIAGNTFGVNNILTYTHAGLALAANTKYWIVLEMLEAISSDGPGWWIHNADDDIDAGGSFPAVSTTAPQISTDNGASWSAYSSGNFRFSLTGITAVPEPARALFASLGCFALLLRRRR